MGIKFKLWTNNHIGNTGNNASREEAFDGIIDDVRIYTKTLSLERIAEIAADVQ